MKLISFDVDGMLGREGRLSIAFNGDLSILTGRNGAGKTSVLKLVWYVISGNILLALKEVPFSRCTLRTSEYSCTIHRLSNMTCKVEMDVGGTTKVFEDGFDADGDPFSNAEDEANEEILLHGRSVFFPTFRRIEGGFSLEPRRATASGVLSSRPGNDVEEALLGLARKLTNDPHVFVSAISTADIVSLLLRQYTDLSEEYNKLQQGTSQEVINSIKEFQRDPSETDATKRATDILGDIQSKIEGMEVRRGEIMAPMTAVQILATKLFAHTGIKFSARLSFGDAANAVNSEQLSAGEKQMLSFICYNAFYRDAIILIDEPELSLHVDWQRQLFPILQAQQSSNQFIIATHSPFIYSKYPDREVLLSDDRGEGGLDA